MVSNVGMQKYAFLVSCTDITRRQRHILYKPSVLDLVLLRLEFDERNISILFSQRNITFGGNLFFLELQ